MQCKWCSVLIRRGDFLGFLSSSHLWLCSMAWSQSHSFSIIWKADCESCANVRFELWKVIQRRNTNELNIFF